MGGANGSGALRCKRGCRVVYGGRIFPVPPVLRPALSIAESEPDYDRVPSKAAFADRSAKLQKAHFASVCARTIDVRNYF